MVFINLTTLLIRLNLLITYMKFKNVFLYFEIKIPKTIQYQIYNMTSVLANLIHKDNSVALFNGSNNANYDNFIQNN